MSETNKKYIAFLFLLCIAATFVSFNPFHDHIENQKICHDGIESESNACHISIFHKDVKENHCKHETHIFNEKEECDQCKFTSTRRYQFIFSKNSLLSLTKNYQIFIKIETSIALSQLNSCIQDRAPPIF